jgi:hypothetical protein
MGRARISLRSAALVVALLGVSSRLAAAEFFEEFGSGWEGRWISSADEKYSGRFKTDTPKGWEGPGLKVGYFKAAVFDEPSRRHLIPCNY